MAKITYTDKVTANPSGLPDEEKFTSGDANEIKASVNALYDAAPKIYRAILSQSGTDAPTAVVLENTLGGVPVLTRDSEGYYLITLAGAFLETKIFIDCPRSYMDSSDDAPTFVSVFRLSNNACAINTLTSDGSIKEMNAVAERSLSLTIYTYP